MGINEEFEKYVGSMTDKEWHKWIGSWFDYQLVVELYNCWDEDLKKESIEEIKEIIKKRKGGKS